jgi:hypothetical protein
MTHSAKYLLLVSTASLALAGCGSSTTSTTTQSAIGGPPVTCDQASIDKAMAGVAQSRNTTAQVTGFKCAQGWAVVNADVGPSATAETFIFEAEGQFWILKDRAQVCPSPSPVPQSLQAAACNGN